MITLEELKQYAPHAHEDYLQALVKAAAPTGELTRAGVNTTLRLAHFLAQTAHETGGYTIVRESTHWTPEELCQLWPSRFKTTLDPRIIACRGDEQKLANLAYSGRKDLGNVGGDDGWAYRGGGFLQLTGRASYHEAGAAIGVDLEGMPELIEDPVISLNVAVWEWTKHNLNAFADRSYAHAIGNAINRGSPYFAAEPIGAKQRLQWLERAWSMLGAGQLEVDSALPVLALGAYGVKVKQLQQRLAELGYGVGTIDKVFGPTLARAVAAFKLDNARALGPGINPETEGDELVGHDTWHALELAKPIEHSPERTMATVATLANLGSTEVAAGQAAKTAGQIALYTGGAQGLSQIGVVDVVKGVISNVDVLKSSLTPTIEAAQWLLGHAYWVVGITAGVWIWTKGSQVVQQRLEAHKSGANLGR